ncbi:MAG: biotin--[Ruminococcus sp.]|nr:biotin--[acetyl-CoA-carboxylase] ligase [Ruminococcus sp.]
MNVKEALIKTLAENNGGYISGAALAEQLGVSRNAVWKAVKSLEAEGYAIESIASKGYRMSQDNNRLSAGFISSKLNTRSLGRNIFVLDETGSTNNDAKEKAAAGAPHGTVVIADRQTMGKGRLGRSFISPSGTGVYISVVIRPEISVENAGLITAAAAVAAAEAVEKLCRRDVSIKWVNDLYINGKKICGILTEASMGLEMKSLEYAVIGIGINVRSVKSFFDDELSSIATSIEDETGVRPDRNELCAELLDRLEYWLDSVETRKFLPEYRRREYLTGKLITANVGGVTVTGSAVGIDNNANLMVEMPDGEIRRFNSGEANLCRVKK